MKILKKIPFFPFLLVLFFCLHGTVENYGYIDAGEVLFVGVVILISVTILFLVVLFFTKDKVFAALITFFIALWYLFFGAIQDWLLHRGLLFLQRYSVIVPVLIVATIAWVIFLKNKRKLHPKLLFYFNILLVIYCLIDVGMIMTKYFSRSKTRMTAINFDYSKVKAKPNVYFMLFDEYPGYKSLKDSFGFANDSLYNFLHRNEFRMLPVFSNYDFTLFSMSAILNMRYVDSGYDASAVTQRELQLRINEIRNASVVDVFKKMDYRFKNYSIFDVSDQHAVADQNAFLPVHSVLLTDKILHYRLMKSSGWWIKKFSLWKRKYMFQHDVNNQYSEKMLVSTAAEKKTKPVFCYAHFALPHGPFYRDSTGKYNTDEQIDDEHTWSRALYLSYVKYTNTVMESLVQSLTTSDPGAIIVIMGDHGYRSYKNTISYEPFNYNTICAVRFPGKNYPDVREKWSAVNIFRYLFNAEYGQNIPYLADTSIVLTYPNNKK